MTTNTYPKLRFKLPLFLSIAVFASALTWTALVPAPEDRIVMHFDGPQYHSVEDLALEAEVAVEVKIRSRVASTIDYGDEPPVFVDPVDGEEVNQTGIPLAIFEAQVFQNHGKSPKHQTASEFKNGDRILIAMLDDNRVVGENVVKLSQSERYLLFLTEVEDPSHLDVDLQGRPLYMTLNDANGVLEFDGKSAKVSETVWGLTRADAEEEAIERLSGTEELHHHEEEAIDLEAVLATTASVRS